MALIRAASKNHAFVTVVVDAADYREVMDAIAANGGATTPELRRRLAAVLGADSLPVRKPDPRHLIETIARAGGARDRAVLVGDTTTDREAARAAGVPCVLVTFGPEGAEVARMEPAALLDAYADLPDLVERLVPALPAQGSIPA